MDSTRFRECMDLLGWSQRQLADYLDIGVTSVQRWAMGRIVIPDNVAAWLEARAAHMVRYPYPEGWKFRAERNGEAQRRDARVPARNPGETISRARDGVP